MDAAELAGLKRDALQAVRDVLADVDAKPADRLRAAEVVARLDAPSAARGVLGLDDQELLLIARGEEGGTPREKGPGDSSAGSVPSDTDAERDGTQRGPALPGAPSALSAVGPALPGAPSALSAVGPALPGAPSALSAGGSAPPPEPEVPRGTPNPFLIRKKGSKGTQNGPAISGDPTALIASGTQIGNDRTPEPWE